MESSNPNIVGASGVWYLLLCIKQGADLTGRCVTRGVIERLWDTTSTFYLLFGEMTIAHFDFAMLTGTGFTGELLVYQEDFHTHCDQLLHLLSPIMESIPLEDHFSYSILIDLMQDDERWHNIHLINSLASFSPFFLA